MNEQEDESKDSLCRDYLSRNKLMGIDINYRRFGCDWPKTWRLKGVYSSKFKQDNTIVEYFDSLEELFCFMSESSR